MWGNYSVDRCRTFTAPEIYIQYWGARGVFHGRLILEQSLRQRKWRVALSKQFHACTTIAVCVSILRNLRLVFFWEPCLAISGLKVVTRQTRFGPSKFFSLHLRFTFSHGLGLVIQVVIFGEHIPLECMENRSPDQLVRDSRRHLSARSRLTTMLCTIIDYRQLSYTSKLLKFFMIVDDSFSVWPCTWSDSSGRLKIVID